MKRIITVLLLLCAVNLAQAAPPSLAQIVQQIPDTLANSVANNLEVAFLFGSKAPRQIRATGEPVFVFDPRRFVWAAYNERGRLVKSGMAAGGSDVCPEANRSCRTPVGTYRIYRKGPKACESRTYPLGRGGAPMPYCMFFHDGSAIHGAPGKVRKIHASHGCIRVSINDAEWLSRHFIRNGTRVIIKPY